MNLNQNQIIAIIIAVLSVLAGSTAQLTDLFGSGVAKTIISVATLGNTVLSSVLAVVSSQGSVIKQVLAMPGIQHVDVNAQANSTVATLAMDSAVDKISPTPAAATQVAATARAAS